jgi:ATP-dependent HslUV protease ATP-binding subunit HslU
MVRDLMDIGMNLVREEANAKVREAAEQAADDRLLDLLLPVSAGAESRESTREKLRALWRQGHLDGREVEFDVREQAGINIEMFALPGMEQMGQQMREVFTKAFPAKTRRRKMKTRAAWNLLLQEESAKLVDEDALAEAARERVEQEGIIFVDEIDKIAETSAQRSSDVSRQGVQRDLLPVVEGCNVNTKYGIVRTDHILFIAAGAFHACKPSDLLPELQGRFPLRVELQPLGKEEFLRILTEPDSSLTRQYSALLATEDIGLSFGQDALEAVAAFAEETNNSTENIGARRLYTIMEKILADISFEAPEKAGSSLHVDRAYVEERLADLRGDTDLSRYVL